ncbi:uncharacterized protein K02A2.6-like [Phlebotomus papatasi]|uniref:uncharacterized protein K02A2.6-like n=1 Tax=Phlebotomus papatasi TaxID=29031 RepID=UPI0024838DE8|nr:uncharacterized protein K02A2.6-like [Phlebotomus papatasi]
MPDPPAQDRMGNAQSDTDKRVLVKAPPPIELGANNKAAWEAWEDAFNWYAIAVELDKQNGKIQVAVLMSALGSSVKDIFENFGLTDAEKSNLTLVKQRFRDYFAPSVNEVYESFRFHNLAQEEEETLDEFVTRVRVQANKCSFPANAKERLIRDKVIHGLKSSHIREEVLRKRTLTLDEAIAICKSCEQAEEQSQFMTLGASGKSDVHVVKKVKSAKRETSSSSSSEKVQKDFECDRCGYKHAPKKCPASDKKCNKCGIKGHFVSKCKLRKTQKKVKQVDTDSDSESVSDTCVDELRVFSVNCGKGDSWEAQMTVEKKKIVVKIDTGAQCNVITKSTLQKLQDYEILPSRVKRLVAFNGGHIKVQGRVQLQCKIRKKVIPLWFQVIGGDRNCIIDGKSAVKAGLIAKINEVAVDEKVFSGLGQLKNFEYDAELIENPTFVIHPARNVPYRLKEDVKKEIDQMVEMGVVEPCTEATDAVSPMVVVKRKGKLRICADLTDVNSNIKRRHYPLTGIDQVAANVSGSRHFTILDCKKGFWQIPLSKKTSRLCTFATPWGRFSYRRLPFGLVSAPELFQRVMMDLLGDLEGVEVSMDDILIHAETETSLKKLTEKVIQILSENGLKLNREKCVFNQSSVIFLGHRISADGLRPDESKLQAIDQLQVPTDKKSLQRFLGMINYVGKFIPNLSDRTEPLRQLLKKDSSWVWTEYQQRAFEKLKMFLKNPPVLAFYDVKKPIVMSVDSSSNAFGAVLMQGGKPIAYATKSLTSSEKNWPQIEKEAGAIRFACQKFHDYIWGQSVCVESDHKPLETIFSKSLTKAPPRLRKILHEVKAYDITVKYVKGTLIPIADALSRDCFPEPIDNDEEDEEIEINAVTCLTDDCLDRYKMSTQEDPVLNKLIKFIMKGWPETSDEVPKSIRNYFTFREELSFTEGLIFKGDKVVVPETERKGALKNIHAGHIGVQASLRRARDFLYWPGMNSEITDMIGKCLICERNQRTNQKETLMMKRIPEYPFEIIATDLFTFKKQEYILMVDSYSGYFDFKCLKKTGSSAVIKFLKDKFADHGIPQEVHSDGGPQFASKEFKKFAKEWKFDHVQSSPYFARSNGLAERYVQTAKKLLKKCREDGQDVKLALLLSRNTPGDGLKSPAERLFSRKTRNPLCVNRNLLMPKVVEDNSEKLQEKREQQKKYGDIGAKDFEELPEGERVRVQERDKSWSTGTIKQQKSGRSYIVAMDDGRIIWRNRHFLQRSKLEESLLASETQSPVHEPIETSSDRAIVDVTPSDPLPKLVNDTPVQLAESSSSAGIQSPARAPVITTRSGRVVKPPDRLNL